MANRPERVLAIDVGAEAVRGMVLSGGAVAVAGGYAQLSRGSDGDPAVLAARIAKALDATTSLAVFVTCDPAIPEGVDDAVVGSLGEAGFAPVSVIAHDDAVRLANPDGDANPSRFNDAEIADGLLASHPGLSLGDLAAVVGAGLAALGLGASHASSGPSEPEPVAVWERDPAPHVVAAASAAAAVAPPVTPPAAEAPPTEALHRRSRRVMSYVAGVVVVLGLLGLMLSQCGGDDESATDSGSSPEPTEVATSSSTPAPAAAAAADPTPVAEPTEAAEPTPSPAATATPQPTATPATTETPDPPADLVPLSSLPERGAVFRPPILYLEGPVQTQEQADELYQRAIEVVGPDNVVNEYVVRPDAPAAIDGNVRVEQAVLFRTGSAEIADEFIPTLELGVAVMALNPQVTMVVEGHTDSVGSDELNQRLSEARAASVVAYLVSRGVDAERLRPVGFGESAPVADNETDEGRQINRRIEVELIDLLSPRPGD